MTTAFGTLLRRHRLTAGLSQATLAERARLSTAAIAALERGRRATPRPETLALLVGALGLSLAERAALADAAGPRDPVEAVTPGSAPSPPVASILLPSPVGGLIGRERDEAAVVHLLTRHGRRARSCCRTRPLAWPWRRNPA